MQFSVNLNNRDNYYIFVTYGLQPLKGLILLTTTICLIRHGETDWNAQKRFQGREDIELNENGKIQTTEIAEHLGKVNWDVIISSPLKRAYSTAQIIAKKLKIENTVINENFIERDYGKASGLTFAQWKHSFPDGIVPGKENDESLKKRVITGLDEIVGEYKEKNILLISHGAVINSILKTVSNGAIDIGETNIKNACFNLVLHNGTAYSVELFNSRFFKLLSAG